MARPYARLSFDEPEFQLVLGALVASRAACFERWVTAKVKSDAKEIEFYDGRVTAFDAQIAKFEAVLVADRSQDAEEEHEEEEDEE